MRLYPYTVGRFGKQQSHNDRKAVTGVRAGDDEDQKSREDLLVLEPKAATKRPPFYRVVMLNDDFTPMDFVVEVLKAIFRHSHEDAIRVMLEVHHKGAGTCGVYTRDVAETKVDLAIALARKNEYPLQCVMEKE
jgi:ATP-dependent Clp protease adaptor protein ClpS